MTGAPGFEPGIPESESGALTAWLCPNTLEVYEGSCVCDSSITLCAGVR